MNGGENGKCFQIWDPAMSGDRELRLAKSTPSAFAACSVPLLGCPAHIGKKVVLFGAGEQGDGGCPQGGRVGLQAAFAPRGILFFLGAFF